MAKLLLVGVKYGDFEGSELLVELDRVCNEWILKYEQFVDAGEYETALVKEMDRLEKAISFQEKLIQDFANGNSVFRSTLKAFKYFDDLEGVKNNLTWMDIPINHINDSNKK